MTQKCDQLKFKEHVDRYIKFFHRRNKNTWIYEKPILLCDLRIDFRKLIYFEEEANYGNMYFILLKIFVSTNHAICLFSICSIVVIDITAVLTNRK